MAWELDRKQKVLHVIGSFSMGGVETWLLELLRYLRRQGPDGPRIDFLAASGFPDLMDEEVKALGARIFYLRYGRRNLVKFMQGFRQILKDGGYSAIHDHQGYTSGWHFLMGTGLLPRIRVTHVHNAPFELRNLSHVSKLAARIGKRLVASYATQIVGTSRQLITEYDFDTPNFSHIPKAAIHCGFDAMRFLGDAAAEKLSVCQEFGWPADARIILFAGRIDASPDLGHPKNQKNSGFAVSVGIDCARRDDRVRMLLVGALSPAVPILEQRIAAAGFSGRIRFIGIRRDIPQLMHASDVLLFPSRAEGLGMVAVEAQAAGLPVLASATVPRECVVVPELVRFRKVEAGASAWATDLLDRAAQPRNLVRANRQVAASAFAIENSTRALARLYNGK